MRWPLVIDTLSSIRIEIYAALQYHLDLQATIFRSRIDGVQGGTRVTTTKESITSSWGAVVARRTDLRAAVIFFFNEQRLFEEIAKYPRCGKIGYRCERTGRCEE